MSEQRIRVEGQPFPVCPVCGDAQCAADEHDGAVWIPEETVCWRDRSGRTGLKTRPGFWAIIPE